MNLPEPFYQWLESVQKAFPNLKKWQALGLALFSYGIITARSSQASVIAEELPEFGKAASVEKRLKRWLKNEKIDIKGCFAWWVGWVLKQYDGRRYILLVDETKLGDRIGVMMVALAFEGRAIPLLWRCYIANSAEEYPAEGQVNLVQNLIRHCLASLPDTTSRVVVMMDMGLGNSSNMMDALQELGVRYLLRVKKGSVFTSRRNKSHKLWQLAKPGEQLVMHGWIFTRQRQRYTTLHLIWAAGYADPWCLVSNVPTLLGCTYAYRMWIEEGFRDLKRGGWQWQACFIRDPARVERLILALALAYTWILTQGVLVLHADPHLQAEIGDEKTREKYSVFRLGLRFFKRLLKLAPQHIYPGLFLAPNKLLC